MRRLLLLAQELLVVVSFDTTNAPKGGKRYRVVDHGDEILATKDSWPSA